MRHHEHDDEGRTPRRWWLRVRALLAGGLVLGVGTAVTVAAWNDGEYVDTTITAGTFQVEGSTTSATAGFADHASPTAPAGLSFSTAVSAVTPGTTSVASFFVRTKGTSVAGSLALQTPTFPSTTGLQSTLTYGVRLLAPTQACNAAAFGPSPLGTSVVPVGTTLNAVVTPTPQPIAAAGSAVHHYCFAITLPATADNSVQGLSATPNWHFLATAT